jgi:predicted dehydrogenase
MSSELRFCLTSLVHDQAWWSADQVVKTPGARLVAVADEHADLRDKMRQRMGDSIQYFSDVDEMLDATKPDVLVITAPNSEHRRLVEKAATRRIHIIMQKPLATTVADARAIQASMETAGIKVMANYYPLWRPHTAELSRRLQAGEVGDIQQMTIVNGMQGPKMMGVLSEYYKSWMYDPVRHGGGVLADQATYGIDYVVWMLGRPKSVFCAHLDMRKHPEGWVDDMVTVVLTYPHATATVTASWAWPHPRNEILCFGPGGSLCLREGELLRKAPGLRFDIPVEPDRVEPAAAPPEREYGIAWFVHALQHGLEIEAPHSVAVNVTVCEVVEAAKRSIAEGRAVTMP